MKVEKRKEIANSFSDKFEEFKLSLPLSKAECALLKKGIYAKGMDEKWNIFILDTHVYFARSWTNHCIFKILISSKNESVVLERGFVTRDKTTFKSGGIDQDRIFLLKVLQTYFDRDDLYSDPEFEFDLIKQIINAQGYTNNFKKSIGHNNVGLTKQIHEALTISEQKKYFDVVGWEDLRNNIELKRDDEPLLSLYVHNIKTDASITFYFDKDAHNLLGQIEIKKRSNKPEL